MAPSPQFQRPSGRRTMQERRKPRPRGRARALLAALLGLIAPLGAAVELAPAAAGAASAPTGSISLVSQTPWVRTTAGMHLDVSVDSTVPAASLEVQLTLYNELTRRYDFEQTTYQNQFPTSYVQGDSVSLPLTTKGLLQVGGTAAMVIRLAPPAVPGPAEKAPSNGAVFSLPCTTACAGVYPLEVSLLDSSAGYATLSQFTTYLVVVPPRVVSPLRFCFVLPLGTSPAMSATGDPTVPAADESEISQLEEDMATHPNSSLSLALYPQLSDALAAAASAPLPRHASRRALRARSAARRALAKLRQFVSLPNVEAEQTTYTPVDLAAMAGEHLTTEEATQVGVARASLAALGAPSSHRPFVTSMPIGPGALGALTRVGVREVLVPSTSVSTVPLSWYFPVWAPFRVKGSPAVVDASDAELERYVSGRGNPVLRAEQLLADLAIVYFVEQPPGNRGMTLLAPRDWRPSQSFLSTLLAGLSSSTVVRSVTLSQFFDQVPPGSDEIPPGATASPILYRNVTAGATLKANSLPTGSIARARVDLAALDSLLPAHSADIVTLDRLVLIGETVGLTGHERAAYLGAPGDRLRRAAREISLPHGRTITITSLSAKVPILVSSRAPTPLAVDLRLSSCPPGIAGSCSGTVSLRRHIYAFVLQRGNNTIDIHLSARSSGDFFLYLQLTAPNGTVLTADRLQIRSTAISGVAILLTVVAGLFLVVWWGRSELRRRRSRPAVPAATAEGTAAASSPAGGGRAAPPIPSSS
jgi:hypothetical protein